MNFLNMAYGPQTRNKDLKCLFCLQASAPNRAEGISASATNLPYVDQSKSVRRKITSAFVTNVYDSQFDYE